MFFGIASLIKTLSLTGGDARVDETRGSSANRKESERAEPSASPRPEYLLTRDEI
jgi:hypothetical protein